MEQYTSILKELPTPKFVSHRSGCEVISNQGDMRILLKRTISFFNDMEQTFYLSEYYVKEDNGWLKTNTSKTYNSTGEFIRDLAATEEFSQAVREYKEAFAQANGMI